MSVDVTVENTLLKRKLAAYEKILKEKERDPLTDLYSRQRFFERENCSTKIPKKNSCFYASILTAFNL